MATYTFTSLITPGGSSSPLVSFSFFSLTIFLSTSIWREVISSISSICSFTRGSLSLYLMRFRLRVEIRSISSRFRMLPLVSRRLLVRSSCRSAWTSLPPRIASRRFKRSSVRIRISSERFFSSLPICSPSMNFALVFFLAFAREDLDVNDDAFDSRRAVERSIANVSGFFTEDGAQQFFFRRQLGLALRRNFADQNVALLNGRAYTDDTGFVQIAQHGLADVRNVAGDFFRTELGVAGFDLVFLNVERGVVILFHQFLGNENCVFEVVPAPRH